MTRVLAGNSIKTFELDDEEEKGKENNASFLFDSTDIINSIGTEDFKYSYLVAKNDIIKQDLIAQKDMCKSILEKIEEVYDFIFPETIYIDSQEDVNNVLEFLEFLEYDHIDFLARSWAFLGVDLKNLNIEEYCYSNSDKLLREIEEVDEISNVNEMVSIFLRTYYKKGIVEFIVTRTVNNKMEIILRNLQGGT